MNRLYEPWGYDDMTEFSPSYPNGNCCGCDRSEEQKKIDTEQDEKLDAEIKRSEGVDSEQDKKIKDIEAKLGECSMYETDEE